MVGWVSATNVAKGASAVGRRVMLRPVVRPATVNPNRLRVCCRRPCWTNLRRRAACCPAPRALRACAQRPQQGGALLRGCVAEGERRERDESDAECKACSSATIP